jgi:PHB/PHA accumulation regulator DNA-binding domain
VPRQGGAPSAGQQTEAVVDPGGEFQVQLYGPRLLHFARNDEDHIYTTNFRTGTLEGYPGQCPSLASRLVVGCQLETEAPMSAVRKGQSVLVKRFARSRLYDTTNRRYVSVEQHKTWAAEGIAFAVIDAETVADITRALLA